MGISIHSGVIIMKTLTKLLIAAGMTVAVAAIAENYTRKYMFTECEKKKVNVMRMGPYIIQSEETKKGKCYLLK